MSKRALLVNDSKFESLIMKDMLQQMDYSVEIADEYDALYAIEHFNPNVIIVNYIMEQTRGDKLIQLVKAGVPDVKCILSSSNPLRETDFDTGIVDGVIQTPISKFLLEKVIDRLFHHTVTNEDSSNCDNCNKDLSMFGDMIEFCPFCGSNIKDKH